ncbi:hypothetical protein [uncultured Hoeflea sp.]|uniref:hypothetical protein n=1 Tax=uncultured Hoeflea sp. TaxID=538666 RepID=UPI0026258CE3|nr:hypothetical protein [uncultured Hoeflea sp.]
MTLRRFLGKPMHLITGSLALIAAIATGLLLFGGGLGSGGASTGPVAHGSHSAEAMTAHDVPKEAGQSAFAAVAEIVAMLEADPQTNWSRVDITALREHLVDMDRLMLGAKATASFNNRTAVLSIRGEGPVLRAIHTMVPAHALELSKIDGWDSSTTTTEDGATLRITVAHAGELAKIKALGFFGVMALGAHHQPHHLAMARGDMGAH